MSFSKSILVLGMFAALGTAQATVVESVSKSTAGSSASASKTTTTTTYTENFNGATSFSKGEYNAASTTDDYLWLTNSQSATWSFSSAVALQSVTISFAYSVPGADTGFFKFASTGTIALADTPGTAAQFKLNNPGASTGGSNDFDGYYSATYSNLAAGKYTLTFSTDAPDCNALSGLKVDDLKITTITTITAAVPEPETYALMLAGIGAIWFMARRRARRD